MNERLDFTEENWILVTPARNEAGNLRDLAENLLSQEQLPAITWIVVTNACTDDTLHIAKSLKTPFPLIVLEMETEGTISSGSAFKAWDYGVQYASELGLNFRYAMKLDADVRLNSDYFKNILLHSKSHPAIIGGVLNSRQNREQLLHVQGAVKAYSKQALEIVAPIPRALGFDVMDEIAIRKSDYQIEVVQNAHYTVARQTGSSEGLLNGRRRNGAMCSITGYDPFYFILHLLRYTIRKPLFFGCLAILYGYLTAPKSPYAADLLTYHAAEQRSKMKELIRNPVKWLKNTYSVTNN